MRSNWTELKQHNRVIQIHYTKRVLNCVVSAEGAVSYVLGGAGGPQRWFAVDGAGRVLLVAPLDYERHTQVRP